MKMAKAAPPAVVVPTRTSARRAVKTRRFAGDDSGSDEAHQEEMPIGEEEAYGACAWLLEA